MGLFTSNRGKLYYVFKALNNLKTNYDVFSTSYFTITQVGKTKSIHLFDDEMDVVILGNFDVETKEINPDFPNTGNWYEYYTGDTLNVITTDENISLLPGEYRLYTSIKLVQPDIPASIFNVFSSNQISVNVFPNPATNGNINISFKTLENEELKIRLTDLMGKEYFNKSIYIESGQKMIITLDEHLNLGAGIYLIIINSDNCYTKTKLVIQ